MTAEYMIAVHAMVYLYHKKTIVSSIDLAENICTNPARVRKVMAKLRNAELILAKRGKGSGYQISEGAGEFTLNEVLQAIDEEVVFLDWKSGSMDKECLISSGMAGIMGKIYGKLNNTCKEVLEGISIKDINDMIFEGKGE